MKALIPTLAFLACGFSGSLLAEPSSMPDQVAHSGFCNAVEKRKFVLARSLLEGGTVDLKSPCPQSRFGVSPELANVDALVTSFRDSGFGPQEPDNLQALAYLLRQVVTSAGGVNAYLSSGHPLYLSLTEDFFGSPDLGELLLDLGADLKLHVKAPNFTSRDISRYSNAEDDPTGMTLLMYLCRQTSAVDEFFAPKVLAYKAKTAEAFVGLVRKVLARSDLDARDAYGRTPLHHCILHENKRLASELLARGAQAGAHDDAGLSPLDYAVAAGESNLVDILKNPPNAILQDPADNIDTEGRPESTTAPVQEAGRPEVRAEVSSLVAPTQTATIESVSPLNVARESIKSKDFRKARQLLSELVKQGNSAAMYELGRLTIRGEGGAQNIEEARKLWEQAAEQNHGESLVALAKLYHYGDGVPKSSSVSKLYIERARARGAVIPSELEK